MIFHPNDVTFICLVSKDAAKVLLFFQTAKYFMIFVGFYY